MNCNYIFLNRYFLIIRSSLFTELNSSGAPLIQEHLRTEYVNIYVYIYYYLERKHFYIIRNIAEIKQILNYISTDSIQKCFIRVEVDILENNLIHSKSV